MKQRRRSSVAVARASSAAGLQLRRTTRGWRLLQHGTVLSEMLARPGPTHSVFDVLAAATVIHAAATDVAVLGFGGGGTIAALRALHSSATIHAVDLDPTGHRILRRHRCAWLEPLRWQEAEAGTWLEAQARFDVILDDLSVAQDAEVIKPDLTWDRLPSLVPRHLHRDGIALFNLLRPRGVSWSRAVACVAQRFPEVRVIALDDFENRIVMASRALPPARTLHAQLKGALQQLGSWQATRFHVRAA